MSFTTTLLHWFSENGRELPWRATKNPYTIWLSEIILQQTRVEQGMPYWQRFVEQWPTVEALACATEDDVLRAWQGLGYYSRARHLHTAAQQIVQQGRFPNTLEGIRVLKGVGDYTAAAIASFAFDIPAAAVDGNVFRVLSRHYGISTPINSTEGKKEFTALAQQLLPPRSAADFNQAMMDFGATLCTPQAPRCTECPLQESCVAYREGRIATLPVKQKKLTIQQRQLTYVYIRWRGTTAIHQRQAGDIWQGLWEPWLTETVPDGAVLLRHQVRHVLTHRVLLADFWLWEPTQRPSLPPDYIWIKERDFSQYAVPRLIEKLLASLSA